MITETVKISNRSGLHARPAMMIVQKAGEFNCDITIAKEDVKVNAKSIMGVMMLAAEYGASITLTADGADERAALDALKQLFDEKFNEEY
ncbi:HPr family phosphocarrier protein [Candidatus Avelusimicrobium faecicola]|uniref:HPr family phosphocarrier protein n=1 Tax=Candidatus Avelusimicrobium faecicola TaxID=3416205 RepID=UPI002A602830|nr:HPr family phosphocarrier protein [Spirochaetota bacterium]MCI7536304.1 HPr family phosphocarrier protein [Spirochaetota bacterium]MDE3276766.1 HPr family phosphocarrier protein [Spirochaetota bacterium]MDY2940682.1 HPr family phosphocarrier protein [Elusimicrobiaceae bacterium]MDY6129475.1 HPr family phosphocarrier protein [Elusimicrobiaceae bacterium]